MIAKNTLRKAKKLIRLCSYDIRISSFKNIIWFLQDYFLLKKNRNIKFEEFVFYPCLNDKTLFTPIEPTYFFQDTWVAEKIFKNRPSHHYDVGSSIKTMGILSQFVPVTIVDIRTIDLKLNNLHCLVGSILSLPFKDNSIYSLSSLCVVEHVGLGRYGDKIDSYGSEKAIKELQRVLAKGGDLYFSVPVDRECLIYFNAHRAFTRDYVLEMFLDFDLIEEKYHYGRTLYDSYDPKKGFGTGFFYFRKSLISLK